MPGELIRPDDLKRITEEIEMAKAREALEKKRNIEQERDAFRETFMSREIQPEVFERLSRLVKGAAERGEREVLASAFQARTAPTAAGRSTASSRTGRRR